jgi:hypothetical protein
VSASTLYVAETVDNPTPKTATIYFRTNATNINDIKIATSNDELLSLGTVTAAFIIRLRNRPKRVIL